MNTGAVLIVDAQGCDPARLRSVEPMAALFHAVVEAFGLHAVADPAWHVFPGEGGVTGFLLLSESHLSCHTYPEHGFAALDLYCCRDLPRWAWEQHLGEALGASSVTVRTLERGRTP